MGIHSADCSPNDVAKGTVNCPYTIWMNEKVVIITLGTYNWVVSFCVSKECHMVVAVDQTLVIDSTMDGHWFIHFLLLFKFCIRCLMQKSFAPLWSTQTFTPVWSTQCTVVIILLFHVSFVTCYSSTRQISAVLLLLSMLQCPCLKLYCFYAYCSFL